MLSSNWYIMLRLTVFKIFAVKWQNRYLRGQKCSTRAPFLTLHLLTPKISPPKGEKVVLRYGYTIVQTFTPIGILALHLSYKNTFLSCNLYYAPFFTESGIKLGFCSCVSIHWSTYRSIENARCSFSWKFTQTRLDDCAIFRENTQQLR